MTCLLFPGRHLVNTRFQEAYLGRLVVTPPARLPGLLPGTSVPEDPPTEILFAITSSNQENSRFNPIPFHIRAVGVDRFAAFTIKEIAHQSEERIRLTPGNCVVLCSTPEVIRLYQALGFSIAPAESGPEEARPATPIEIVREIGERGNDWRSGELVTSAMAASHLSLFQDFPEVPERIGRLYQEPLTNQEGSLTDTRTARCTSFGATARERNRCEDIWPRSSVSSVRAAA